MYKLFKYDFKYSGQEWYKFENHIWFREIDGICLRSKISTDLCEIYFKIISKYNKNGNEKIAKIANNNL